MADPTFVAARRADVAVKFENVSQRLSKFMNIDGPEVVHPTYNQDPELKKVVHLESITNYLEKVVVKLEQGKVDNRTTKQRLADAREAVKKLEKKAADEDAAAAEQKAKDDAELARLEKEEADRLAAEAAANQTADDPSKQGNAQGTQKSGANAGK